MSALPINVLVAICLAAIAGGLAIVSEVFRITSDEQFDGGRFFRNNYNKLGKPNPNDPDQATAWNRIIWTIIVVGSGQFMVASFADIVWANWLVMGACIVLIIYQVVKFIGWISRVRELFPTGALILLELSLLDHAFDNILAVDGEAMMLNPMIQLGSIVAIVAMVGIVMYRRWVEDHAADVMDAVNAGASPNEARDVRTSSKGNILATDRKSVV